MTTSTPTKPVKKKSRFDISNIVKGTESSTAQIEQYINSAVNSTVEQTPTAIYNDIIKGYRQVESTTEKEKYTSISKSKEMEVLLELAGEMPEVAMMYNTIKKTQASTYFLKLGVLAFLKARASEQFGKDLAELEILALKPSERIALEKQLKRFS